jgi:hypothetical protein
MNLRNRGRQRALTLLDEFGYPRVFSAVASQRTQFEWRGNCA